MKPDYLIQSATTWIPRLGIMAAFVLFSGLYFALWQSPPDYLQGETVRIMYIHVPASWGAMSCYGVMALIAGYGLIKRIPFAFIWLQAIAPVGFCLCLISLITGAIWGKPTWGTWWVWDARITSMFLLGLLYLGYLGLVALHKTTESGQSSAALLVIIGAINLPIIKWSVDWWHTLHQPASILRWGKPSIHPEMLIPLFVMALGIMLLAMCFIFYRLRTLLLYKRWLHYVLKGRF
jgi:heme exporter protein C